MRNKGVLYDITRVTPLRATKRTEPYIAAGGYQHKHFAKMGKDEPVAMDTLAKICVVLDCTLDDIVELGSNTEKGGE